MNRIDLEALRAPLVVALAAAAFLLSRPAAAETLDRIVLRVNDQITTLMEYNERRDARLQTIAAAQGLSTEERRRLAAEAGKATMREIFDELLVLSRADQLRFDPTSAQVDAAIESTRQRMGLDTDEEFAAALASSGLTPASFRDRMEKNIAFNEVLKREVEDKVKVEDDVVLRLYRDDAERWKTAERRRVEELVVREESAAAEERRATAEALARALAGGDTLAAAAERLGAAAVAGPVDLGWVTRGELAPALDEAVWSLPAGGVSAPIEGRGGLHVVRVVEIDAARVRPFEEVREEIRAQEGQRRFELATREFLADLERKAFVVETVPDEARGWREALPETSEAQALGAFAPQRLPATEPTAEPTPEPPKVEPSEAPPSPPPPN